MLHHTFLSRNHLGDSVSLHATPLAPIGTTHPHTFDSRNGPLRTHHVFGLDTREAVSARKGHRG